MKKYMLPAALAFAVVAAFAFKPKPINLYYDDPDETPRCQSELDCVIPGKTCLHTVYSSNAGGGGTCQTPVNFGTP